MNESTKMSSLNVGFVLFVATVIVIVALFWVGSGGGIFQHQVDYHFMCPSTSRLKDGSRVYLSGVPVVKRRSAPRRDQEPRTESTSGKKRNDRRPPGFWRLEERPSPLLEGRPAWCGGTSA